MSDWNADRDVAAAGALLTALTGAMRARDVEVALGLFTAQAILYGSESGESAVGHAELRRFLSRLFARPVTFGWVWDDLAVHRQGDVLWFVTSAQVVMRADDARETAQPYRLSGVLVPGSDGRWRLDLFHGSEPV